MAFNVKTELLGVRESTSVVDLSSDDNDCILENNNIEPERKPPERPRTPDTNCSICLDVLSNKCYSDSCWHMFCFECLKRWSTIEPSCPLCKKNFKTILHTFNDQGLHETYVVPIPEREFSQRIYLRPFAELHYGSNERVYNMSLVLDLIRRNQRLISNYSSSLNQNGNHNHDIPNNQFGGYTGSTRSFDSFPYHPRRPVLHGYTMRIRVYRHNMWADPLPDVSGRYRECSSSFFRENPAQTHRLHGFILRDVNAIRSISYVGSSRTSTDELTNIVMEAVTRHDIRDAAMINLLRPYLPLYVNHFCHELFNFANSPYDMIGYDNHVQYSNNASPIDLSHPSTPEQIATAAGYDSPRSVPAIVIPAIIPLPEINVPNETIVLDSESDVDQIVETSTSQVDMINDEVIIVSSSAETADNDSEIEILEHRIRPSVQFNCNLSIRDQPSTSTGIRDSSDRPNNRYHLRRRKLYQTSNASGHLVCLPHFTCPSGLRSGESVNILSSSSDDESTNIAFVRDSSQAMHVETETVYGKRKRKVKKSKVKKSKVKRNDDSSGFHFSSTNRSYSDLSSSDESDARPQNRHASVRSTLCLEGN